MGRACRCANEIKTIRNSRFMVLLLVDDATLPPRSVERLADDCVIRPVSVLPSCVRAAVSACARAARGRGVRDTRAQASIRTRG